MEIKIISPEEGQYLQPIVFNFEELKASLEEKLQYYNEATYDDSVIRLAKADRATLNKLKEAIDNKRKEVKKQCLAPYDAFETKIKQIVEMLNQPILQIDSQIKIFEEKQREEKYAEIEQFFNEQICDLKGLVSFKSIANPKWKNVGYTMQNALRDIEVWIFTIRKDIESIKALNSKDEQSILAIYFSNGYDLSGALQESERIKAIKQATASVIDSSDKICEKKKEEPPKACESAENTSQEEFQEICFRCWLTNANKAKLRQFMIENNIKYGRI